MKRGQAIRVLSGEDRSILARLMRPLLTVPAVGYALATDLRNRLFDLGWKQVHRVDVPVISIGNLTTGGTGKTPTVAWLVNWLSERGHRPGILSRGYHSIDGQENDEKRLLDQQCVDVPHIQNRDRIDGARRLVAEHDVSVIVLDDGFQHRRLHRDLDIVLIDALNPFGYGHLLPRGLLRERPRHLQRADVILITRCESSGESQLAEIENRLRKWSDCPIVRTEFATRRLVDRSGTSYDISTAAQKAAVAFCGLGNPGGFRRTLARLGAPVTDQRFVAFPDHHHYSEQDFRRLAELAIETHSELFLTTRKDLVKVPHQEIQGRPVLAVDIELSFQSGSHSLQDQVSGAIERFQPPRK